MKDSFGFRIKIRFEPESTRCNTIAFQARKIRPFHDFSILVQEMLRKS